MKGSYLVEFIISVFFMQHVSRYEKIKAQNGRVYYLMDVITQILQYLKIRLEEHLQQRGHQLEATDFDWVIIVPTIWRARGKQMMREAGYKVVLVIGYARWLFN